MTTLLERAVIAALADDDDVLARITSEKHEDHRLAPEFKAIGMHESPCMAPWCEKHDEEHANAYDEAETRAMSGERHPHALDLSKPLHGFETHANADRIYDLVGDPSKAKGRATVMLHKGRYHVMDGHHRITAGIVRGDSHHPVNLIDMDGK